MSPLGGLLESWLNPALLGASLFVGWWAIWFTLGRAFLETLSMLVAARAVSTLGAFGLLASGALGVGEPSAEPGGVAWIAAAIVLWLLVWGVENVVLGVTMKRKHSSSWRWDGYDLAVLGIAHVAHVAGAVFFVQ